MVIGNALADGILQLVQRIVLADVLGKVIIQLRQFLILDLMKLDFEGGILASQLFRLVLLGELNVHIELVACLMADNLLLEAGNEGTAAQHQCVVLGFAALERLAVHKALKIDGGRCVPAYA